MAAEQKIGEFVRYDDDYRRRQGGWVRWSELTEDQRKLFTSKGDQTCGYKHEVLWFQPKLRDDGSLGDVAIRIPRDLPWPPTKELAK